MLRHLPYLIFPVITLQSNLCEVVYKKTIMGSLKSVGKFIHLFNRSIPPNFVTIFCLPGTQSDRAGGTNAFNITGFLPHKQLSQGRHS